MRAAALPLACILASLLAGGHARRCQTCFGTGPNQCTGSVLTCNSTDDSCLSIYTVKTVKGVEITEFSRLCGKSRECTEGQTLSAPQIKMRHSTSCCSSDNCTPQVPTPPPPLSDTKENGVKCPACYAQGDSCDSADNLKCTGSEKKCVHLTMKSSIGPITAKVALLGCASENMCAVHSRTVTVPEVVSMETNIACTGSGIRPEHSLLLPVLAALLLLKFF